MSHLQQLLGRVDVELFAVVVAAIAIVVVLDHVGHRLWLKRKEQPRGP